MGLGMLILFRHRSSLGGFNVLCLFIQDRFGISVGKSQMAIDGLILLASFFLFSTDHRFIDFGAFYSISCWQ